jgi:hypothetical protein
MTPKEWDGHLGRLRVEQKRRARRPTPQFGHSAQPEGRKQKSPGLQATLFCTSKKTTVLTARSIPEFDIRN